MKRSKRTTVSVLAAAGIISVMGLLSLLSGGVPQTIVIDGVNDFLVANLIDPDGGDTEFVELDLDSVFVTNDANKIYFGMQYDKGTWTSNQIGIHISVDDATGGTTDSWGRAIAWTSAPHKPDFQAYCNMDNAWQELRHWNGGTTSWDVVYDGTNSLGWVNGTGFEELALNLSDLGVAMGDTIFIEFVSTQDGSTKGPFDCIANDDDQLSTPGGTTWDVAVPVELDSMIMYIVQTTGDTEPPVVVSAGDNEPGSLVEPGIDDFILLYNEPVEQTTAENSTNYALTGTSASIDSVRRVPSFPDRVRIYLDTEIGPQDAFYSVAVTNVDDLSNNTIVDNDTTNVGCFFRKGLLFIGRMGLHLTQHSFPTDTFTVEGGLSPLTWGACDNAFMTDMGDSTYRVLVGISIPGQDCYSTPNAEATLEWKFMHQCTEYEPLMSNRQHVLSSTGGAYDTLDFWWNDEDEDDYTINPVDVVFLVDANLMIPGPDSVVAINGSVSPLTFVIPSINEMADDGVLPDLVAGDGIYAITIRFPELSFKNVGFKYLYNDVYECALQGNRQLYLNDAAFDTVGGAQGPIVMPLAYYDRCYVTGRNVEVVLHVDARYVKPGVDDTVAVNGTPNNQLPEVLNWNIPSINPMRDDGVYPDDTAGDMIFSTSIVFPDSSDLYVEYKYLFNSEYECSTQANRSFYIDDGFDAQGNPQILVIDYWNDCELTGISDDTPALPLVLYQNFPNPFNPTTTIQFDMPHTGRAVLRVYNVKGELIKTLYDSIAQAGIVRVTWDGKDRNGKRLASGVYFYALNAGGKRASRKMIMLR